MPLKNGLTYLHFAAWLNSELVRDLLAKGADPLVKATDENWTPADLVTNLSIRVILKAASSSARSVSDEKTPVAVPEVAAEPIKATEETKKQVIATKSETEPLNEIIKPETRIEPDHNANVKAAAKPKIVQPTQTADQQSGRPLTHLEMIKVQLKKQMQDTNPSKLPAPQQYRKVPSIQAPESKPSPVKTFTRRVITPIKEAGQNVLNLVTKKSEKVVAPESVEIAADQPVHESIAEINDGRKTEAEKEVNTKSATSNEINELPKPAETSRTDTMNEIARSDTVNTASQLKHDYTKTIKGTKILVDSSEKPGHSLKNVHFGNSWRGDLEKKRKFLANAAIGSLTKADRQFLLEFEDGAEKSNGKLIMRIVNLRGLVLNINKIPDRCQLYCTVEGDDDIYYTKTVQYCHQNLYTDIPIHEVFSFITDPRNSGKITIKLHLRMDFYKQQGFFRSKRVQRLFQSRSKNRPGSSLSQLSSSTGRHTIDQVQSCHEETICQVDLFIPHLLSSCDGEIFERKWNWTILQRDAAPQPTLIQRLSRSSSRVFDAGSRLFSSLSRREHMSPNYAQNSPSGVICAVAEAGFIQLSMIHIPNLSEIEQKLVPNDLQDAKDWLRSRAWHRTIWKEGYLSQQGGDVQYWRRRFYKITGTKMEAFHEFSMEYRVTIDLNQMVETYRMPCDDESAHYATKNSFRILFKHGETIDFYAETKEDCEQWLQVLENILAERPDTIEWMGEEPANSGATESRRLPLNGVDWNNNEYGGDVPPPVPPKQKPRNLTKPMHSSRQSGDWVVGQLENESNDEEVERLKEKIFQQEEEKLKELHQNVEEEFAAVETRTRPAVGVFGTKKSLRFA